MGAEQKKKKVQWQQWVGMGFYILMGAACGILMVMFMEQSAEVDQTFPERLFAFLPLFLGMYISIYLQLIIHEAGHLVFGLRSGYQFSSFRIGSFMWLKENGKIVRKRLSIAGTGGQCLMVPPEMQDGCIPVVLYNLGGCIMNLIASAGFFAVFLLIGGTSIWVTLLLIAALVGVIIALTNGIPMRMGTVDNDGFNALSLGKSKEAMHAFWLQLKVNELIAKGERLKDMPDAWFAVPTEEAMGNSMVAVQGVFACNRRMDQHQFAEADQLMAHLLEIEGGMVGLHRNLLVCDRIYCELIQANRPEALKPLYDARQKKFMKSMKQFPSVVRTEYALALLAEHNTAKAEACLERFEKIAKTYPYPSDIQSERELIGIAQGYGSTEQIACD